jgi:putative membrane protein
MAQLSRVQFKNLSKNYLGGLEMGIVFSIIVTALAAALVIFIVGRLNLGLTVAGFGTALVAAIFIAIVGGIFAWVFGLLGISFGGGFIGAIINVIVAAIVLTISGSFLPGMKIHGFSGAVLAVIAIGIISWIVNWLLGLLGLL